MRLESVKLHNFRQYKDAFIEFPKTDEDIQIIVGKNGVGKTTLLNAINWCLYGDEPHSLSGEVLDIINFAEADSRFAYVELRVSTDEKIFYTFKRTLQNNLMKFQVLLKERGETRNFEGESADELVDDFVPKAIREFFFFDGEQLDNYFRNERTKNIEGRISILSHIDILKRMSINLNKKLNGIKKKAGRLNNDIDGIVTELEEETKNLNDEKERVEAIETDIKIAKTEITRLNGILDGIPDINFLESEYNRLNSKLENLNTELDENENERRALLLSSSHNLFLKDAFDYVLNDIEKKREGGELPKDIDQEVIERSLSQGVCEVCNRGLDEEAISFLNAQLADYQLSSQQSKLLQSLESPLSILNKSIDIYPKERDNLIKNYKRIKNDIKETDKEFKKIEKKYLEHDDEEIKKNYKKRENLKNVLLNEEDKLIDAKSNIKLIEKTIEDLNEKLSEAMAADLQTKELNKQKQLVSESLELIDFTMDQIMKDTKVEIEDFTRTVFFDLLWKKETFSDVIIDDSYNLKLIHNVTQTNAVGSASAAERELLVLAFTLGVHKISGFSSPLLIDTPLARVSDEHRLNFAKVLLEVSKIKQIILLFTPAEFSDDIQELLNNEYINKYQIVMGEDESYSVIEEMK